VREGHITEDIAGKLGLSRDLAPSSANFHIVLMTLSEGRRIVQSRPAAA
jgi:hypothetical protein